ncbi:unnamed protein product [Psylliodes chrysocephalus]|uniref:Insulin-like domain-containing protein n=1 Tax=Psylliodes chrysocephalus TaxID=3402493 RepID=A0A9P0G8E4_9CUCU|nr:unnamed protein product [Psylliodes chrysocephala]
MNIVNILLFIVLNFYCIGCNPYYWNLMDKRDSPPPKKYCGKKLTNMIALVCQNQYYAREMRRPHNIDIPNYDNEYPNGIDVDDKYDTETYYPFLQKSSGLSLLPNKVRRTTGIVNECCDKPCLIAEIQSYCA